MIIRMYCPQIDISGVYVRQAAIDGDERDGVLDELQEAVKRGEFERVILGFPHSDHQAVRDSYKVLASCAPEILICTNLDPSPVPVHGTCPIGILNSEIVAPIPRAEQFALVKRVVDSVIAGLGLIVLLPLFAVVSIAIKLESAGPIFFRQRRYGRNSEIFRIFKFRSMAVTEDGDKIQQARRGDARITRVGRIIRATSIDELPQLINVLLGHMSIVGPRPHALAHDDEFEQKLDLFSRRRRVLPGITGWAQVHGLRGETRTLEDIRLRMEYDLYYVDNWSVWLDFEIMVRTVMTVIRGAY